MATEQMKGMFDRVLRNKVRMGNFETTDKDMLSIRSLLQFPASPFLFDQLVREKWLVPLDIHDFTGDYPDLVAYDLIVGEDVLDEYISFGLSNGRIHLTEDVKEAI